MSDRKFSRATAVLILLVFAGLTVSGCKSAREVGVAIPEIPWDVHDENRPMAPVVQPGTPSTQETVGTPPSDAIVLFDGKDLSQWQSMSGGEAAWKVENGYMEVVPGAGGIRTKESFGDVQLHVEWRTPPVSDKQSQARNNSGVFLMGRYEVQVLDTYNNKTYADGQAGAIYGQYPPLVNPLRPPGEWQVYDIIFRAPRFDEDGGLVEPARMTILLNGVLIQDNRILTGPTGHRERPPYTAHPDALPISLQDHGDPVRFRNIWVRRLTD
jgi:hypothetical protein